MPSRDDKKYRAIAGGLQGMLQGAQVGAHIGNVIDQTRQAQQKLQMQKQELIEASMAAESQRNQKLLEAGARAFAKTHEIQKSVGPKAAQAYFKTMLPIIKKGFAANKYNFNEQLANDNLEGSVNASGHIANFYSKIGNGIEPSPAETENTFSSFSFFGLENIIPEADKALKTLRQAKTDKNLQGMFPGAPKGPGTKETLETAGKLDVKATEEGPDNTFNLGLKETNNLYNLKDLSDINKFLEPSSQAMKNITDAVKVTNNATKLKEIIRANPQLKTDFLGKEKAAWSQILLGKKTLRQLATVTGFDIASYLDPAEFSVFQNAGQLFQAYRKVVTGAQASYQELGFLEPLVVGILDDPKNIDVGLDLMILSSKAEVAGQIAGEIAGKSAIDPGGQLAGGALNAFRDKLQDADTKQMVDEILESGRIDPSRFSSVLVKNGYDEKRILAQQYFYAKENMKEPWAKKAMPKIQKRMLELKGN